MVMEQGVLKAAFRKVKITPEETAPLQGYDPALYIADPAKDILDDLYARVLVLDDGNERQVLICVDCGLSNEQPFHAAMKDRAEYRVLCEAFPSGSRHLWGEAAETRESNVSVHATHTHSAPAHFGGKYVARIEQAVREAVSGLQPVRVKACCGETAVSVNRRPHLRHNDALPIDKTLSVAVLESLDGRPIGAIVNCAVHPTLLINPYNRVSAEFVGLAMSEWENKLGGGFTAMFLQGFCGDVGPYGHMRDEKEDTYPWVRRLALQFYAEAAELAERAVPAEAGAVKRAVKTISLPAYDGYLTPSIESEISALRIGETLIFSASHEVFSGYAALLRPHSPAAYPMFCGVANGYAGYLPTPEAFRDGLGGYELNTTPYCEEAGKRFVEEATALLRQLD
jgi:hypothetical protein